MATKNHKTRSKAPSLSAKMPNKTKIMAVGDIHGDVGLVKKLAKNDLGEMIKAVVDVKKGIIAIGGEWHSDAEEILLKDGSLQSDLWGINLYPFRSQEQIIEFSSLINIRPKIGNRTMIVEIPEVRAKIIEIIGEMII